MLTGDACSSGHLVLSHFGTCKCSNVATNLSWTCVVSWFLSFEHPSVLLLFAKNKCKSQMGQDQVSGGVSVLCWLAAPVAMFYRNLQNVVLRSKSVIKSSSVISLQIGSNVWSIEGFIVYGHVLECHVTFGRGRLHYVWWDPNIDHKTSWGRISNVLRHIPVREVLIKVAPPLE